MLMFLMAKWFLVKFYVTCMTESSIFRESVRKCHEALSSVGPQFPNLESRLESFSAFLTCTVHTHLGS